MTAADFDKLLDRRLVLTKQVLASKAGEYATANDQLHNFKRAAELTRGTPADACVGFLAKHLVSIVDIANGVTFGQHPPADVVDEKIGDAINYLILLEALLKESQP